MTRTFALLILAVGCGGGDDGGGGTPPDGSTIDAPPGTTDAPPGGAFAVTSPVLTNNGMFDAANTCNGVDSSPALQWTSAPAGTLGYAVSLTDLSTTTPLVHWVIYDIPPAAGLPAAVAMGYEPANVAGAHQTIGLKNMRVYHGPCPPAEHTYRFDIYALDVAVLPGATMQTTKDQAIALIMQHDLGVTTLTGRYQQP